MAEIGEKEVVEVAEKIFGDIFGGGEKAAEEAAEKAAKEAAEKVAEEAAEKAAKEAAEKAAEEAAAKQVAEEAAEKVAAAEAMTVESEAGLEARIKAEEEAVEAAEKAAEVEARLGSRIAKALGKQIVAALKGVLQLVKVLAKDAGDLLLLQMAIDQTPKEYRKELASWALMLAAGGNQLALVAYLYMGLSGGSEEGKQVAQEAHQVVKDLHKKARDLNIDSPSNVPIDEEQMKQVKLQEEKDKKDLDKTNGILGDLKGMLKDRQGNKPIEEEENNGSLVTNTMTLAWVGSALGAAGAEGAAAGAAEAAEAKAAAAKEAAATAKAAAVEAAATAAVAAAASAAEAAAAEAVMVKSKAGIEATVKAETEAVEVAKQAARLGARLGARIGAVEGEKIEAGLQGALHLLDRLTSNALLKMGKVELPTVYRKVLAGWGMTVAAEGIKLVLVAFNYMGLSGGPNHAKMVAKNAQQNVTRLHKKALKLIEEESPSNKVPIINKETHQHLMENIKHHVDSEKQELGKITQMLDQIDDSMKKYMKDHPLVLLKRPTQAA